MHPVRSYSSHQWRNGHSVLRKLTEMKAVRSMDTRGWISISCSDATSSSSGGVREDLNEGGSAILCSPVWLDYPNFDNVQRY